MEGYRARADLYKALAHPVRLRILDALARREACVCHLTAVLGIQPVGADHAEAIPVTRKPPR